MFGEAQGTRGRRSGDVSYLNSRGPLSSLGLQGACPSRALPEVPRATESQKRPRLSSPPPWTEHSWPTLDSAGGESVVQSHRKRPCHPRPRGSLFRGSSFPRTFSSTSAAVDVRRPGASVQRALPCRGHTQARAGGTRCARKRAQPVQRSKGGARSQCGVASPRTSCEPELRGPERGGDGLPGLHAVACHSPKLRFPHIHSVNR